MKLLLILVEFAVIPKDYILIKDLYGKQLMIQSKKKMNNFFLTMNVDRRCADGNVQPNEPLNKSQIYLTTAGYKNTFSYEKLITLLVRMITEPDKAIIMGGTYKIPVLMGLLNAGFVQDLQRDGTFNEASFEREYESKWTGVVAGAFFSGEAFDRCRKSLQPEYEYSGRSTASAYYVIGVDVGRKGCDSVAMVVKVTPQSAGPAIKSIVNIETRSNTHFEEQAIWLKKLYYAYKARMLVIDANGQGIGLVDYMVKAQFNKFSGESYPDFGVANDPEGFYKQYRTPETEYDAMYLIKANATINTEAHVNIQSQMNAGKLKFLIDERTAKQKLMGTKMGQTMSPEDRATYLRPFTLTSILREELLNLREDNEGINIILKCSNKAIGKDKFSALEYALYYIKEEEDQKKKKKKFNVKDFMFMS